MPGFVMNIELAEKNVMKELGVSLKGMFRDILLVLQKVQTTKTNFLVYKKFACNCVEQWKFGKQ